jgi:hypothetical protein
MLIYRAVSTVGVSAPFVPLHYQTPPRLKRRCSLHHYEAFRNPKASCFLKSDIYLAT